MSTDVKMRLNTTAGEVELVYGESVAMASGKDVFDSWGKWWADTNGYVPKPEPKEEPPVSEPKESGAPEGKPVEEVNPSEPPRPGPTSENEPEQNQEVDKTD